MPVPPQIRLQQGYKTEIETEIKTQIETQIETEVETEIETEIRQNTAGQNGQTSQTQSCCHYPRCFSDELGEISIVGPSIGPAI